ncbi:MAG: NADP-dependent phosphogluconate dehydrogenase [Acidobacteria bacterium]|nr:NADP-dependent phosphogluconate dehydrogenase [Acidobacteriota bacterium]
MKRQHSDVAMIGLGVMGSNLALNMADHRFDVSVWNLDQSRTKAFIAENPGTPGRLTGCRTLKSLVASLERPRRIVMLIKAGAPVDSVNRKLLRLLDDGDVVVDGGNSLWSDTERRQRELASRGVRFIGSGVSGGELGARFGPSLMPGGDRNGWLRIKPVWNAIAARVDRNTGREIGGAAPGQPVRGGVPCTSYIGEGGSGHYVKMVHNGIEYADMQLICEAYLLLTRLLGLKPDAIAKIFASWNEGELDSYLIEIAADLLAQKDPLNTRRFLVDLILDTAGQKGTGKWTGISSLDMGVPAPTITLAVFARFLSALKDERVSASTKLRGPKPSYGGSREAAVAAIRDALYASKICAYAQGFALLAAARRDFRWKLDLRSIARIWRGGCIIRARFLQRIASAYEADRRLPNLMLDRSIRRSLTRAQSGWRTTVRLAATHGVACPAFMSALAYYDGYRSARLPANILQGLRDYFGAHSFERVDRPRGQFFHVDWADPSRPIEKK